MLAIRLPVTLGLGCALLLVFTTALAEKTRPVTRYRLDAKSKQTFRRVNKTRWKQQLEQIERFRSGVNAELGGQAIGLFESIRLAPRKRGQAALELPLVEKNKPLVIRPKQTWRGMKVISKEEIVERWNKGEAVGLRRWPVRIAAAIGRIVPFGPFGAARKATNLWRKYNPLGEKRLLLSRIVGSEAKRVKAKLDGIDWSAIKGKGALERARSLLVDLVSGHTLDRADTYGGGPVRADVLKKIEAAGKPQLEAFAKRMGEVLANDSNTQAAADAALVGGVFERSESWHQLQKAWFAVAAVQNHKRVDVEASLKLAPNHANFKAYVPKTAKAEVAREQRGFALLNPKTWRRKSAAPKPKGQEKVVMTQDVKFAIFIGQFVDDIDVKAQALINNGKLGSALPTYALQQALAKLEKNAR